MRRVLIVLSLTFFALPVFAQTSDADWAKCTSHDPDASIARMHRAIQSGRVTGTDLANAYQNRGIAYVQKNLYDQAIADFSKALSFNPNDVDIYYDRGTSYSLKDLYDRAIADFTRSISLKPDYAYAYNNRGTAYNAKALYDQAIADEIRAISSQSKRPAFAPIKNAASRMGPKASTTRLLRITPPRFRSSPISPRLCRSGPRLGAKGLHDQAVADYRATLKFASSGSEEAQDAQAGLKRLGATP